MVPIATNQCRATVMMAGPLTVTPGGYRPANPGSRPLLRRTMTCNRPFTQPLQLDFRDRLLKAPATARSYDLPEARVKKLSGTRRILFGSSAFRINLLKTNQEGIFRIECTRKPCFMAHAWLWMNLRLRGIPLPAGSLPTILSDWLTTPGETSSGLLSLTR